MSPLIRPYLARLTEYLVSHISVCVTDGLIISNSYMLNSCRQQLQQMGCLFCCGCLSLPSCCLALLYCSLYKWFTQTYFCLWAQVSYLFNFAIVICFIFNSLSCIYCTLLDFAVFDWAVIGWLALTMDKTFVTVFNNLLMLFNKKIYIFKLVLTLIYYKILL